VLGIVGNVFGIPYALVAGALTTLPAAGLYARASSAQGRALALAELPDPAG
jgi:hypothetical protein